jgi:hypothetical protein
VPALLSTSSLLAFRQCERRLWLELHRPELRQDDDAGGAACATGHRIGDVARRLYAVTGQGALVDPHTDGCEAALARSRSLSVTAQPIFEARFEAAGVLAFAAILLPVGDQHQPRWRMVDVKSSTGVKAYHRDAAAIQAYVARGAGVALDGIALAHIDNRWTYPGGGDYRGLLIEQDLTGEAFARGAEVEAWIASAQAIAAQAREPIVRPGGQCSTPYDCGFAAHCRGGEPQATYPVTWLPQVRSSALKQRIEEGAADMRDVPDDLLTAQQLRVKACSLSGETYFDAGGAAADLAPHPLPASFLDFETINFAVPVWPGTRPYQMIPFQFSVHHLGQDGALEHADFLDLSGNDPSRAFAEALVGACMRDGPVFVYNASFEKARIAELAERFADMAPALLALRARVVDLYPIARTRYYHPDQRGSWSIKHVLPAVAPDLRYDQLEGVQDGGAAMDAYVEAIDAATTPARKIALEAQLRDYCGLDTFAMVRLWQFFAGKTT